MTALFSFMQQFDIAYKLKAQQKAFRESGEKYLASEYEQVYAKVLGLFDQIVELMGDETLEVRVLSDILDSGFEELSVGFIPAAVDRLVVGDLMRTRLEHIRVLFVIGCNDGLLPKRADRGGILSDYDREILKGAGMELALAAREEVFCQQYYLYLLLTKPSQKLYVSFSETSADGKALRPAHLKNVITKLFPKCQTYAAEDAYQKLEALMQKEDGFLLLINGLRNYLDGEKEMWWQELYRYYMEDEAFKERLDIMREGLFYGYKTEKLDKQIAKKLFGGDHEISISRLEKYVNAMTNLYRLEDIDIPRQQITFHSLIDNFNNTAEALCYDKHFSITASGDNITLFINLDTVMQIYENLLSNSIRYAKSDIAISVVIENDNLVISVSDDGCGFKNIEIEKATLPFYKSSKDMSTEHLGLGLNISKILSERHGGNIQIANNKAGGACVTVKINCNES